MALGDYQISWVEALVWYRVSKNAVFGLNFLPGFWTWQILWIMPILTGFGPNPRGPKSGQGKLADLDALEFDKDILCHSCDNETLGKLERYASLILYDGYPKIVEYRECPDGRKYTYCAGIDYTQFKLFLLSVLWRASISKRPLFGEVRVSKNGLSG